MAAPETLTRSRFADLLGVNRSTVTRWADAGRLVLDKHGNVIVEPSRARLIETGGGRDDVAARHAANRGAAISEHQSGAENAPAAGKGPATGGNNRATMGGVETRTEAQARKEAVAADLLEIELAQKRGNLVPKEAVDAALKAFATSARSRLDVLPDQLAPVIAPVSDLDEVHALLAEYARDVQASIADDMMRQAAAVTAEGAP